MQVSRKRLFFPVLCSLLLVSSLSAQELTREDRMHLIAPTSTGETGLFTLITGDTLRQGDWSFSLYYNNWDFIAAEPLNSMRIPTRRASTEFDYDMDVISASVGVGLTDRWEVTASLPYVRFRQNANDQSGFINGYPYMGEFNESGLGNLHLATKFGFLDPDTYASRLAMSLFVDAPTGDEESGISTGNPDYGVGLHWNYGVLALSGQWRNIGDRDADDSPFHTKYENNDEMRFEAGLNVPLGASMTNWVTEFQTIFYDGGDRDQDEVINLTTGIRHWFGTSGWSLSAGVRSNLAMIGDDDHGDACPLGGVFGLAFAPVHFTPAPLAPPAPTPVPPPPPPAPEPTPTPTPEPPPVTPPRQPQVVRTDEIHFESGSARLTNIAKAILDDVALRMRQEPTATGVVIGYTDNRENTGAGSDLDRRRAEAVRDYLVSRHGIDASRITVEARGTQDAVGDNTTSEGRLRNRRSVIRLMIP